MVWMMNMCGNPDKRFVRLSKAAFGKRMPAVFLSVILVCLITAGCMPKRSPAGASTQDQATADSSSSKMYYLKNGDSFSFIDDDASPAINFSAQSAEQTVAAMDDIKVDFIYEDLYDTENAYERLMRRDTVAKHQYNAADSNGKLNAEHLNKIVKDNNERFLNDSGDKHTIKKSFYKPVENDKLLEICEVVVDSVERILRLYPDIDRDRVNCCLGYMKIFYYETSTSFASVDEDNVMKINRNMLKTVAVLQGEGNEERDILIHEVMHMVQHGCPCEKIPNCSVRVGISKLYDDDRYNSTYFSPLFEGSAEKSMGNITGDKELTYATYINYIDSLDLCTLLDHKLSYNYIESISFYDDPQKLFDVFHASSDEDNIYAMKLMMTINYLQETPDAFLEDFVAKYHMDQDEKETLSYLRLSIKPDISLAMSKLFYENLSKFLAEHHLSQNDLCCLIKIWESRIDKHLSYDDPDKQEYNERFLTKYKQLRKLLFDAVSDENGNDFENIYRSYDLAADKKNYLNAGMNDFSDDERNYLLKQVNGLTHNFYSKIA